MLENLEKAAINSRKCRWFDFTFLGRYKPGPWVTIIDESKEPITLAEIRVYGSK